MHVINKLTSTVLCGLDVDVYYKLCPHLQLPLQYRFLSLLHKLSSLTVCQLQCCRQNCAKLQDHALIVQVSIKFLCQYNVSVVLTQILLLLSVLT